MGKSIVETMTALWSFAVCPGFRWNNMQFLQLANVPDSADAATLLELKPDIPIEVVLAGQMVLVREQDLPNVQRHKASAILRYDALSFAERIDEDMLHAERLVSSIGGHSKYNQVLARKSDVEAIRTWLNSKGLCLGRVVSFDGSKKLTLMEDRKVLYQKARWIWGGVSALCFILLASSYMIRAQTVKDLEVQLDGVLNHTVELQTKLVDLASARSEIEEQRKVRESVQKIAASGALSPAAVDCH